MSASSAVITEFLASIGFQADEKSLKSSLLKVAGFAVAVQGLALGIYAGLTRVASGEAELAKQAERLHTSTERIRELGYVAEQSGSSVEAITSAMKSLVDKNPRIKDSAAALEKIGDRMAGMSKRQRELYADRWGIDRSLIPMLIKDTSALKDEFKAMYDVAGINAREAAESSKGFMAELGKLTTMAGLLARGVSLAFIGRIRHDVETLQRAIMENFGAIKRTLEVFITIILRIAGVVSAFVYRVIKWVSALVQWYDKLDVGQKKLVVGLGLLLAAWRLLNAGFLATPLGMIIMGLTAIIALIDDYQTYMEGGESYFDWGPWAGTIEACVGMLKTLLGTIFALGSALITGLTPAFQAIFPLLKWLNDAVMGVAKIFLQVFTGDIAGALDTLYSLLLGLSNAIRDTFFNVCGLIGDDFAGLWGRISEAFPNFAAMAERGAAALKESFTRAVAYVKELLADLLPDWLASKLGISKDSGGKSASAPAPATPDLSTAALNSNRVTDPAPALTPGPAQAAALSAQNNTQTNNINVKADMQIYTDDAVRAGNQAASRLADATAEQVRNTRLVAK